MELIYTEKISMLLLILRRRLIATKDVTNNYQFELD